MKSQDLTDYLNVSLTYDFSKSLTLNNKMKGICRLCNTDSDLRESHIIPSFVYKWLKTSSGTGFIRFGEKPNLRSQDGFKIYLLCDKCEKLFNSWETEFANSVFHPLCKGSGTTFHYGSWMLKFAVSVSWRVLNYFVDGKDLSHFPVNLQKKASTALSYWQKFLLEKSPHPDRFEQHMLPFDRIKRFNYPGMPPNINRYILRTVDIDAVHGGDKYAYVYSKMGRIVIIGFIEIPNPRQWRGSKLHVKKGVLGSKHYTIPAEFGDYFIDKAKRMKKIQKSISNNQKRKIDKTYRRDLDRAAHSETMKALGYDVNLFGQDAFTDKDE